jgi:hypothetical protein
MPWIKNHRLDITPDYSLPTEGVYRDFFLRNTANRKSVELLRYCEMRGVASIPSWIPDLSMVKTTSNLGVFKADGWSAHKKVLFGSDGGFVIRGVHTSTIALVSTACLQAATTPELIALCRAWIALNLSEPYICEGKMFDAYIKTLIADNINTVVPPTRGRCPLTEECTEFFDVCIQNGKTEGLLYQQGQHPTLTFYARSFRDVPFSPPLTVILDYVRQMLEPGTISA